MDENLKHTVLVEIGVMNILIDLDITSNKFSLKELAFLKLGCLWVNKQKLQTVLLIYEIYVSTYWSMPWALHCSNQST